LQPSSLSLESRLGLLRRRRRLSVAKQLLAAIGPVLVVIAIVLALAAAGAGAATSPP